MKKISALIIVSILISGCILSKGQRVTVTDEKTGFSITAAEGEMSMEGTMQLKDGTKIKIENVEESE